MNESRIIYSPISTMSADLLSCIQRARRVLSCIQHARRMLSCIQRARRVLSCIRCARRVLSVVAAGSAAVNSKMVAASEGGQQRKLVSIAQQLFAAGAPRPPTSANPCTFSGVICNLTITWLEFLCCFDACNYFILPLSPIAAVVS